MIIRPEVRALPCFICLPLLILCCGKNLGAPTTTLSSALTNWQAADVSFVKAAALLAEKKYPQAQAQLSFGATNLPAPYARIAQQHLARLEAAFNRPGDNEAARLDALGNVCMGLHAYAAAAKLKAAAQTIDPDQDGAGDDLKAWRLLETGKFDEAKTEYQRMAAENSVSTWQDYYRKQIQLVEQRPTSLTNVSASLEFVREHYLKGFEDKADLFGSLRELQRVLPYASNPKERLAVYQMTVQSLAALNDENGRDAWEDQILKEMSSQPDGCAEVHLNRGIRAYLRKDYANAVELFRKVCRDYPDSEYFGDALYNLGSALLDQRKYDDAIREFEKLFTSNVDDYKLVPGSSDDYRLYRHKAALRISECYEAKKDYARALDYAEMGRVQYKPASWCHTCQQNAQQALEKRIKMLQDLVKKSN